MVHRWSDEKANEWMARTRGTLVETNLPVFAIEKVGCLNWGLVAGKTNTIYPWRTSTDDLNSLEITGIGIAEPKLWSHDLFHPDGTPYDPREIELFKKYQGVF